MKETERPGSIQIGPATHSHEGTLFHVAVIDAASGVHFLDAWLTPEAFGFALASREQPCKFRLRGVDLIGKRRENKTERVWVPDSFNRASHYGPDGNYDYSAAAPLLAPFEVDGWKGNESDVFNYHRLIPSKKGERKGGAYYSVGFVRYVAEASGMDAREFLNKRGGVE